MSLEAPTPPAPPLKTISNPVDALLSLRGLACLMVVAGHCAPPKEVIFSGNWDLSWLICSAGGVAVRIFFCLSGYLMGKLFYTQRYTTDLPGLIKFWRNRALRLFPLYYFAVITLSLWIYPHILKPENWQYLLRLLTFTYNQSLPVFFNGALWSLSTEVQFYFVVPFIFIFLRYRLVKPVHIFQFGFVLLTLFLLIRYVGWHNITTRIQDPNRQLAEFTEYIYTPMVINLDSFLCGFLLNPLIQSEKRQPKMPRTNTSSAEVGEREEMSKSSKLKLQAVVLLVLLYLATAYIKYNYQPILLLIGPALTSAVTCFFIWAFESGSNYQGFGQNEKLSFKACLRNPLRMMEVLGNLSYSVYVWHLPVIVTLSPIFAASAPLEAYFKRLVVALIVSHLIATATYYLIERPALRSKASKQLIHH